MKSLKLGVAALLMLVGVAGSAFTSKAHKFANTVFFWYTAPSAVTFIRSATLATELASSGGPYFTQSGTGHTTASQYGYTKITKVNPRVYTLYK